MFFGWLPLPLNMRLTALTALFAALEIAVPQLFSVLPIELSPFLIFPKKEDELLVADKCGSDFCAFS